MNETNISDSIRADGHIKYAVKSLLITSREREIKLLLSVS